MAWNANGLSAPNAELSVFIACQKPDVLLIEKMNLTSALGFDYQTTCATETTE